MKHAIFLYFRWILTSEADLKIWPHPGFVEQNALYVETGRIVINLTSNVQNAISTTVMLLPSLFIPVLVVPYSLPSSLQAAQNSHLIAVFSSDFCFRNPCPFYLQEFNVGNSMGTGCCIYNYGNVTLYTKPENTVLQVQFPGIVGLAALTKKIIKSSTCTKL